MLEIYMQVYKQKIITMSVVKGWPSVTSDWPSLTYNDLIGQTYKVFIVCFSYKDTCNI